MIILVLITLNLANISHTFGYDAVFPIPDIGIGIHRNGIAQRVAREWWQIAAEATMVGMPTTGM